MNSRIPPLFPASCFWALTALFSPFSSAVPTELSFQIIETKTHPGNIFTQGVINEPDTIIESSGLYGQSFLLRYDKQTSEPVQRLNIPDHLFAEGIAKYRERICMLTWKAEALYCFNEKNLELNAIHRYQGEGWGLTQHNGFWVMTNGSNRLQFRNTSDFALVKTETLLIGDQPINNLNALTSDGKFLYINQWHEPYIWVYHPDTQKLIGCVDLTELTLANKQRNPRKVLNGLAWDSEQQALWVTGKFWGNRYLIKIHDLPTSSQTLNN